MRSMQLASMTENLQKALLMLSVTTEQHSSLQHHYHQLLWVEQQLQFEFCVLKKIANFVINIYPMLITWYKSSWWMVCLWSTYLPMSVIPHSAPLFLMNVFSSLGIMYKLLTLPMFQRKASNCTDTSSYYWNNGQICWGPERWHQKGNLQEIYLVSKYTLSFSNLLVVASKRKFWKTTPLTPVEMSTTWRN